MLCHILLAEGFSATEQTLLKKDGGHRDTIVGALLIYPSLASASPQLLHILAPLIRIAPKSRKALHPSPTSFRSLYMVTD